MTEGVIVQWAIKKKSTVMTSRGMPIENIHLQAVALDLSFPRTTHLGSSIRHLRYLIVHPPSPSLSL